MRSITIIASLILTVSLLGCETFKSGKNIAIDSPLKDSKNMQSLSEARQEVEKSRRLLDECLEKYSGDESKCQREKENYDSDVEQYVSLQAK